MSFQVMLCLCSKELQGSTQNDVTWFQPLKVHGPDLETMCWSPLKGLPSSGVLGNSFLAGLPAIHLHHFVLVDVLEDVRRVHEDADGADGGDDEEDVQLKSVDHHGNELPVFANLESEILFWFVNLVSKNHINIKNVGLLGKNLPHWY